MGMPRHHRLRVKRLKKLIFYGSKTVKVWLKLTRWRPQKSTSFSVKLKPNNLGSGVKKSANFRGTKLSNAKIKCIPHFENEYKDIQHASSIKDSNTQKYNTHINTTK